MNRNKKNRILQKVKWLEKIVHKRINVEKFANEEDIDIRMQNSLTLIRLLKQKLQYGRSITKSDMDQCNYILKYINKKEIQTCQE